MDAGGWFEMMVVGVRMLMMVVMVVMVVNEVAVLLCH